MPWNWYCILQSFQFTKEKRIRSCNIPCLNQIRPFRFSFKFSNSVPSVLFPLRSTFFELSCNFLIVLFDYMSYVRPRETGGRTESVSAP